ncbi:Uncharacterised protein [Mycobacteroides abscessus subsp. abscessus]|nr:Uncharacterised protein [Mycobacteroides abscessus subsp. abscessus]
MPHNQDYQYYMPLALALLEQNLLPLQELQVFALQRQELLLQQALLLLLQVLLHSMHLC